MKYFLIKIKYAFVIFEFEGPLNSFNKLIALRKPWDCISYSQKSTVTKKETAHKCDRKIKDLNLAKFTLTIRFGLKYTSNQTCVNKSVI